MNHTTVPRLTEKMCCRGDPDGLRDLLGPARAKGSYGEVLKGAGSWPFVRLTINYPAANDELSPAGKALLPGEGGGWCRGHQHSRGRTGVMVTGRDTGGGKK